MKVLVGVRVALVCGALMFGQQIFGQKGTGPQPVALWPGTAPGSLGSSEQDQPAITAYSVEAAHSSSLKTRTAVIVCPGGGYATLSMEKEGSQVAEWLNGYGITAFVLRYRLGPRYHHPVELGDAQRAIRWVRGHAVEYGFDTSRVGIWGFSAGGHLASTAETHFDSGKPESADPIERLSSRPDFGILAYPVVTMQDPYVHKGSRTRLLGEHPAPDQITELSNELHVTKDTPPTFLFHTSDDPVVPVQNSVNFYTALRQAGVPAEMHIFEHGQHGVGLARNLPGLALWPDLLAAWLQQNHWR